MSNARMLEGCAWTIGLSKLPEKSTMSAFRIWSSTGTRTLRSLPHGRPAHSPWVYNSCVRSAMLHASETRAPTLSDLHSLQRNDRAITHWICSVTTKDQHLQERMQLDDLSKIHRTCQLRGHGHVDRSNGELEKIQKLNPIMATEVIGMDCLAPGLTGTHHSNRKAWSGRFRSFVRLDPPLY